MTAPTPPAVEIDLPALTTVRDGLPLRRPQPLAAVLRWDPADPWAVELGGLGTHRPWMFGWELLPVADGCTGRAGDGDVRIRRTTPWIYEITLDSPDGTCTLQVDAMDLVLFVAAVAPRQPSAASRAGVTYAAGLRTLLDGTR